MRFRKWIPDALICIGLFLLPLAFFWQVTLGSQTLLPADNLYQYPPYSAYRAAVGVPAVPHNGLLSDLVLENYQWKLFIREALANRELPLWNPYLFSGVPFLAAGQHSALYPFSVIYYVLPLERAYGWFTVSQLWLAGFFMYLFLRGLGVRRIGALFAGIAYQMSGFYLASVVFQMIIAAAAWLPFLLLMCEYSLRRRPLFGKPTVIPWIAMGGIGLGMCILAGHVEIFYYTLLVMGFWCAWRISGELISAVRRGAARQASGYALRQAVAVLCLVGLGLGIGAVQLVPLVELVSRNFREGSASLETVRSYAYPPRHILAFMMPNIYGSPAQHEYFDVFTGATTAFGWQRADKTWVTDTYWEVNKNYVEGAGYVGILTLVLAALAVLDIRRTRTPPAPLSQGEERLTDQLSPPPASEKQDEQPRSPPYRVMFLVLAGLSVTFMFGTLTYALLYYGLPGVNQLHSPFRWVWPFTLAVAALAGFGADSLSRAFDARFESPGTLTSHPSPNGRVESSERRVRVIGYGLLIFGSLVVIVLLMSRLFFTRLHSPIEALWQKLAGASTQFPNVETFFSVVLPNIALFGVFVMLSGAVLLLSQRNIRLPRWLGGRPVWEMAALAVIALDLVIASAGFNPAADPAWLHYEPPAITWLKAHEPQNWRLITVDAGNHPLNADLGMMNGLQDVGGYDSIIPKQYVEYMQQVQPQTMLIYNRVAPITWDHLGALDSPALDELGVKYILSEIEINNPTLKQVFEDRGLRIYENSQAAPLVTATPFGNATIREQTINQVIVDVNAQTDANQSDGPIQLTLHSSQFPGWRAYLRTQGASDDDEKEIPIVLDQGNFRSVQLPGAGNWTIRFKYTPQSVQIGAFTTFVAFIIIAFMLLVWVWRLFFTSTDATGVQRIARNSGAPIFLSLFNRAIDFGFAVIMLRVLSPAAAGAYYYAVIVIGWFDILTNFGLNTFLTREVSRDPASAAFYLRRTSLLRLGLAIAWIPLLLLFVGFGQLTSREPLDTATLLTMLILYISLIPGSLNNGLSALFYAFEKAAIPAAVSTATAIVSVIARLIVLLIGFGIVGLAGASLLVNFVTLGILLWLALPLLATHRHTPGDPAPEVVPYRVMLGESWPLMLNHLLATVFFKIDVVLLERFKGKEVVAQYSVAYKWVDAIGVIPAYFTMAMLPLMSRQAKDDRPALMRNYQLAVKLLTLLSLPVAIVTTFLAPVLIGILGGARYVVDGTRALQLMIWFIPIGWINSLTQYVLIALNMQRPLRWPFIVGVLFNIGANLLLIPLFSFQGASVVTILSEVVLQIGFYILLRQSLGTVPWVRMLARPVFAASLMGFAILLLWSFSPLVALLAGGLTYAATLLLIRPFSQDEMTRLSPLLPGPLRRFARLGL